MKTTIACAALTAMAGSAMAEQRCHSMTVDSSRVPVVTMAPGGLAAVTLCIVAPDDSQSPELVVDVDGQTVMNRRYKGNCGTVSGRDISIRARGSNAVAVSYCIEQVSLRPGG